LNYLILSSSQFLLMPKLSKKIIIPNKKYLWYTLYPYQFHFIVFFIFWWATFNFINIILSVFRTKVRSKPNSKQRKDFRTKNVHLKCWWNWYLDCVKYWFSQWNWPAKTITKSLTNFIYVSLTRNKRVNFDLQRLKDMIELFFNR